MEEEDSEAGNLCERDISWGQEEPLKLTSYSAPPKQSLPVNEPNSLS